MDFLVIIGVVIVVGVVFVKFVLNGVKEIDEVVKLFCCFGFLVVGFCVLELVVGEVGVNLFSVINDI